MPNNSEKRRRHSLARVVEVGDAVDHALLVTSEETLFRRFLLGSHFTVRAANISFPERSSCILSSALWASSHERDAVLTSLRHD